MIRILSIAILLATTGLGVLAQNCTQTLRTARSTYEQGRLHEIPSILEGCLKSGGFTQPQKVEAYRILVLSYIYLEEPQKADEAMLELLNTDHFFRVNPTSDPVEFQSLYKKFRTAPVFSYGVKVGMNSNTENVTKNYYMFGPAQGQGKYKANLGFHFGLLFEKALSKKVILNPEVYYSTISYLYSNGTLSSTDPANDKSSDDMAYTIDHNRLQVNCMVQYRFLKGNIDEKLSPYISVGPSFYYLMSSTFSGDLTLTSQTTIPSLTTTENYKTMGIGAAVSAGIKYKIGSVYVTADVRYIHGLNNVVKEENRFKKTSVNESLQDAGYVDNDFTLNQSMVNVGLIIPYFSPKKLIR